MKRATPWTHAMLLALAGLLSTGRLLAQGELAEDLGSAVAQAVAAHENHDFERCSQLYLKLYARTNAPHHLLNAATCQYDAGNDARETLQRVLNLDPPAPEVIRNQASVMLQEIASELREATPAPAPTPEASPSPVTTPASPSPVPATTGPNPATVLPLDTRGSRAARPAVPLATYLLGAVSAAGVATGTGYAIVAQRSWQAATSACPNRTSCPTDRGHDLSARARRQGNLATAGYAVSAATGVGALLFWVYASAPTTTALNVNLEQAGASLQVLGKF